MSLVELMVGLALGLFLVAGAATLFVSHLGNSRRMLVEARMAQDMRAAGDLITRDLRRAGYWANSLQGTVATGAGSVTVPNPYRTITPNAGSSQIEYQYSRDTTENNALDANEQFGFRLNGGAIQMKVNGTPTWQTVTDPDLVTITAFTLAPTETPIDIRDSCAKACCGNADVTAGTCATANVTACPTISVRQYVLTLAGRSATDASVRRTLQTRVRVRNDGLAGSCPA